VTPDLDELAGAAAGGDRRALAALIRLTQHDVTRFLAPLTSSADLPDLVQETYVRVVRALPAFQRRSSVRTWLFAIARHVAADHVRHLTRRPRAAVLADWQTAAEDTDPRRGHRFEEYHALVDLVAGLLPQRREAFLLTQVAGLSYAEAAEVCQCPVGTIRSRVARARDDLVRLLDESQERGADSRGRPASRQATTPPSRLTAS
jgi:RNA polymerase sigma-70 factor, ECF subfamily